MIKVIEKLAANEIRELPQPNQSMYENPTAKKKKKERKSSS